MKTHWKHAIVPLSVLAASVTASSFLAAPAQAQIEVNGVFTGAYLLNKGVKPLQSKLTPPVPLTDPEWSFGYRADLTSPQQEGWPSPLAHVVYAPTFNANALPGTPPLGGPSFFLPDDGYQFGRAYEPAAIRATRNTGIWADWGGFTGIISAPGKAPIVLQKAAWSEPPSNLPNLASPVFQAPATTTSPTTSPVDDAVNSDATQNTIVPIPYNAGLIRIYAFTDSNGTPLTSDVLTLRRVKTSADLSFHWYKFIHSFLGVPPISSKNDTVVIAGATQIVGATGVFANLKGPKTLLTENGTSFYSYGDGPLLPPRNYFPGLEYNDLQFQDDPRLVSAGFDPTQGNFLKNLVFQVSGPSAGFGTRTQGYYKNHQDARIFGLIPGGIVLSNDNPGTAFNESLVVVTDADAYEILWANVAKLEDGAKRSALGQARIKLAHQLLTAELNARLFGASSSIQTLISAAIAAMSTTDINTINSLQSQLDTYNNSGDSVSFLNGSGYSNGKGSGSGPSLGDSPLFQ